MRPWSACCSEWCGCKAWVDRLATDSCSVKKSNLTPVLPPLFCLFWTPAFQFDEGFLGMTRILLLTLTVILSSCAAKVVNSEEDLNPMCQTFVEAEGDVKVCAADMAFIATNFNKMCGKRVVTFGYLRKTIGGGIALFPDEFRAKADFIHSAIAIQNPTVAVAAGLDSQQSGRYISIAGELRCYSERDRKSGRELGFVSIEVEKVWGDVFKEEQTVSEVLYDRTRPQP